MKQRKTIPKFIQNFILGEDYTNGNYTLADELKKLKGEKIIFVDYQLNLKENDLNYLTLYTDTYVATLDRGLFGDKYLLVLNRNPYDK